jgi:hypothetical protein
MHAVMSRAFQQISCSSYCFKRYEVPKGTKSNVRAFKVLFHLLMFYALKKGDFLERLNFGQTSTPCILGKVTARQNHLHITFRLK